VTLKPGLGVTRGHRNRHVSIHHLWLPTKVLASTISWDCARFATISASESWNSWWHHLSYPAWTTVTPSSPASRVDTNTTPTWTECRLTTAATIHYYIYLPEQPRYREFGPSSDDGSSLSAVSTCGTVFLHLSAPRIPTPPSAMLSKLICSSLLLTINRFYLFYLPFLLRDAMRKRCLCCCPLSVCPSR